MTDLPRRLQASLGDVWDGRLLRLAAAVGIGVASLLAGVVLAVIGDRYGAALVLVLPLGALLAAIIFSRPVVGIAAVYASFPAGFAHLPTDALGLQAAEITVLLVLSVIVLRRLASRLTPLPWASQMSFAVLLVAWALIAVPGAIDNQTAIKQVAQLAGGVLLALAVPAALRSTEDARGTVAILLAVGAGMVAFGLQGISRLQAQLGGAIGVDRPSGVFPHPNEYGAFSSMILLVSVGWILGARGVGSRLAGVAVALVTTIGLAVSLSRGAWIGTVVGLAVLLVLLPRARRVLLMVGIPVAAIGTSLVVAFTPPDQPQVEAVQQRIESLTRPTSNPYDARPAIYEEAFRQIREEPLTGVGPGNFPAASARASSLARTVGAAHAHNFLLNVAAEMGIPGAIFTVALAVALALLARRIVRTLPDEGNRALMAGVAAAVFVHAGQGIVDFTLRNPVLSILTWSLIGLLLVGRREADEAEEETWSERPSP